MTAALERQARDGAGGDRLLRDIERSLSQLGDPRLLRVVIKAVVATVVLLVLVVAVLTSAVAFLAVTGIAWLDPILPWLSGLGLAVGALFLTPLVTVSVLGLFADEVAAAVERVHYPDLPPAAPQGVVAGLVQTLRLLAITVGLNLLALPFYLLLPGLNLVIFLVLNGYLLSREYFDAVAQRRLGTKEITRLRRTYRSRIYSAGVLIAAFALIPLLNLLVPVFGTAFMVHRYAGLPETIGARANTISKV